MFGKIWTGFWVLFLHGKSSLLIYRWGDGRLKQHTIEQTYLHLYRSSIYLPCTLLLVLRCSSDLEASIYKAPGAFRTTWSSQSSPGTPTGSLPSNRGVWSQKRLPDCLAYRASGRPPAAWVAEYLPRRCGYTWTCSCVNTLFGDSAGDEALNSLRPVLATRKSSSSCYNLHR